ncbi:MAG: Gfo/Idh/MocA family oxidoreductase [Planctomycetota bacterium]
MNPPSTPIDRRVFLKGATGLVAAPTFARFQAGAANDAELRVALVGCGGRGTGAAVQALNTGNVRLVAMADAFVDRLEGSRSSIAEAHPEKVDVPAERRFVGFDAYQRAIDEDVDVVVLATPPGFRPEHFRYAVEKGRHVFMEKPVAVDAPGVRTVLEAAAAAKDKKLCVGVGLQRHHSFKYQDTIRAIQDGAVGRPILLRVYWNSAGVWVKPRRPQWNEMEYQMRNWYYFNWLCGDHIVEQHIHNLDVGNWVMGRTPIKARGMGGRGVRTGSEHGEIYDHFSVEYEYDDGTRMLSQCRHQPQVWNSVSEHIQGSEGAGNIGRGALETYAGETWRFEGEDSAHYQREHDVLFEAIRTGREHNEAELGAMATMTAVLGRMATYSGQEVTWDEALASTEILAPEASPLTWDAVPRSLPGPDGRYPIPTPGQYRVV